MLVWIAIIYLLLVGFGSFLDWSVRSRFGTFVFFSVVGFVLGGVLVAVALVFIQATFDMLVHGQMRYHEVNGVLWFVLSLIAGTAWALFQVHRLVQDGPHTTTDGDQVDPDRQQSRLNHKKRKPYE